MRSESKRSNLDRLLDAAHDNRATFSEAESFVAWAFDNFTNEELEERSAAGLWSRWTTLDEIANRETDGALIQKF